MSIKDKLKSLLSLSTRTDTLQFEEGVNWCVKDN